MEQVLIKMARQLDALDEASLMNLWDKHSRIVANFEPSRRWEESVLILSLIQAKHWKNQLFNHQWSVQRKPGAVKMGHLAPVELFTLELEDDIAEKGGRRAKILQFKPKHEEGK